MIHPTGIFEYTKLYAEVNEHMQWIRYENCKLLTDIPCGLKSGLNLECVLMDLNTFECICMKDVMMDGPADGRFNLLSSNVNQVLMPENTYITTTTTM